MSHQIVCPSCSTRLAVDASLLGKKIHCGNCKTLINVSAPQTSAAPVFKPVEQDFSALPSIPRAATQQATNANPYRRSPPKKAPSNKPIILTAAVGVALLILVVGGTMLVGFLKSTPAEQAVVADADKVELDTPPSTTATLAADEQTDAPIQASPDKPAIKSTERRNQSKASGVSRLDPTKRTAKPTERQLVELQPTSDAGLQRVHVPEGYSIAVPAGFIPANRSINRSTAIYNLSWKDGTGLTFSVTSDRSITPDSRIPPVHASTTADGKQTVRPIATSQGVNTSETYKLNQMNIAFFELHRDVSHEDMTEQLQQMFSGAMTPEMKRQYAPLMQKKIAFQSSLVMKAMDQHQMLDIVIVSERPQPFAVPEEWMDYMKTIRREEEAIRSKIPQPFLHRYNPPRPPAGK